MPRRAAVLIVCLTVVLAPTSPALAGHDGKNPPAPATCTVAGNVVLAAGLPTDQVVNFMLTDATGTTGWVLGFTPDGTWSVNVPARTGPTTYQFVGRTSGPGGRRYTAFASCSA